MKDLLLRVVEGLRGLWTRALLRFAPAKLQEPLPVDFNVNDELGADSDLWGPSHKEI